MREVAERLLNVRKTLPHELDLALTTRRQTCLRLRLAVQYLLGMGDGHPLPPVFAFLPPSRGALPLGGPAVVTWRPSHLVTTYLRETYKLPCVVEHNGSDAIVPCGSDIDHTASSQG